MRSMAILVIFFAVEMAVVMAQDNLSILRPPSSPASSIVGMQPNEILKPKSYQQLESAIYSNFFSSDGSGFILPGNFALEFTPYWTKNHHLSLEEYLYPNGLIDQIARNSSFSIASTKDVLLSDSTSASSVGFGYRVSFAMHGEQDRKQVSEFINNLKTTQRLQTKIKGKSTSMMSNQDFADVSEFILTIRNYLVTVISEASKDYPIADMGQAIDEIISATLEKESLFVSDKDAFVDTFAAIVEQHFNSEATFNEFKDYIIDRHGLVIDIAYANFLNFPTNKFQYSIVPKQAFWITPTYQFNNDWNFLKIAAVLRYEWYNLDYYKRYFPETSVFEKNTDYGLSLSAKLNKLSFEIEAVGRKGMSEIPAGTDSEGNKLYRKESSSDVQYLSRIEYNLSDQIVLSYSFGRRFEPISIGKQTLVSLLSVNFGFGPPMKDELLFN